MIQNQHDYSVRRVESGLWLGEPAGVAADGGIRLDEHLVVRFDLLDQARVTVLSVDEGSVDDLLLASLVGFDAAAAVLGGDGEITITPTEVAQCAANIVRLDVLSRAPVLREQRAEWSAISALLASSLVDDGFAVDELLAAKLQSLVDELGSVPEAANRARGNEHIAAAIRLGVRVLDERTDRWRFAYDLAQDLPEPTDNTMQQLADSTVGGTPDPTARVRAFRGAEKTVDGMALPSFRGHIPEPVAPEKRSLIWALIDEPLLPEDDGFDAAVSITQRGNEAEIEISADCEDAPALWARLLDGDGELTSVAALQPSAMGWHGLLPIPESYDPSTDRIEIVDRLNRPVVPDHSKAVEGQWALLELADEITLTPAKFDLP